MSKYSADIERIAAQVDEMDQVNQIPALRAQQEQFQASISLQQESMALQQASISQQLQSIMAALAVRVPDPAMNSEAPKMESSTPASASTSKSKGIANPIRPAVCELQSAPTPATMTVIATTKEKKGELLPFIGENVENWLLQAEKYFSLNEVTEEERMRDIMLFLDGEALAWYSYTLKHDRVKDWQDFR